MAIDKRKYKRYIFPNDENLTVRLNLSGKSSTIEARLLNVSEGGLGMAATKDQTGGLEIDSELLIEGLSEIPQLQSLVAAHLKVRWVLDHHPLQHLGIGCEFVNLSDKGREEILDLIENGNMKLSM